MSARPDYDAIAERHEAAKRVGLPGESCKGCGSKPTRPGELGMRGLCDGCWETWSTEILEAHERTRDRRRPSVVWKDASS